MQRLTGCAGRRKEEPQDGSQLSGLCKWLDGSAVHRDMRQGKRKQELGWGGGGEEMVCSVWGMMSLRCYGDIPVEISNKSSA